MYKPEICKKVHHIYDRESGIICEKQTHPRPPEKEKKEERESDERERREKKIEIKQGSESVLYMRRHSDKTKTNHCLSHAINLYCIDHHKNYKYINIYRYGSL